MIIAGQSWPDYVSHDEILRAAMKALEEGADAIFTSRGLDVVEMLARQDIAVQNHLGLIPRKSTLLGGLRPVGKTADEALSLFQKFKDLENAGAFAAECELIPQQAMAEISKRTTLVTIGLGSGTGCDVTFQFLEDLTGDNPNPPRHARAYANLYALRQQMAEERRRALNEWREDSIEGTYPSEAETAYMPKAEYEKFLDALE